MIVYISGKYSGNTKENIQAARKVAIELWSKGFTALCPHLNTAEFEDECTATYEDYINGDIELLSVCGAVLMLPDWRGSEGAGKEYDYAMKNGIPIYFYPDLPEMSRVELDCPKQTDSFRNALMSIYRMYLKKNNDYGTANILGTGNIGLVTRVWDKAARLMHLNGFKITISDLKFEKPINPIFESIMDSWHDMATYSVIAQVYNKGDWGK